MRLGESKRERYQPNLVPVSELQPSDVGCCRCRKKTIIEGKDCYVTDPGCPEHGFEAFTRKRAEYETQEPREVGSFKGKDGGRR